ncbi:MAG: type II toxin-antitoxin system BrnA family antitoxin [Mycobacteriales bacterium]
MRAESFDEMFDRGEDMTSVLDLNRVRRPDVEPRRVNVDFPAWMIAQLDLQARRLGVTRQSIIKLWIAERLEQPHSNTSITA